MWGRRAGTIALALLAGCTRHDAGGDVVGGDAGGSLTLSLPDPLTDVTVTEARVPGRPLVVIDAGHGGRDPGASGVTSGIKEKEMTLAVARELRDRLAKDGRVRIALTRADDRTLALDQRSDIARRLGAALFVSLHADSSSEPNARGATVYSLSEVASDADAERLAAQQDGAAGAIGPASGGARALLADLAMRDTMSASADFAMRLVGQAKGTLTLRPEPHRFAAFRVLRRAEAPAVLVEVGYLSNGADEAMLRDPAQRARIVATLARAIETELAVRATGR
ncbi:MULTISPECIES: N-acetylmuramoyl-L-alanine amidase family protein [Sphingomonas]|uniref:N-acetylmuramoyl-L-alanine amidase family protein n=1 Tax=Sphingomonas TaxID=13687 RepID=UPI000DEF7D52|nr:MULTISPECIES: N-acetylmuramoyl-L-alanine amidase [Sphingomonas]